MAKKRSKSSSLPEGARLLLRNKRATYDYEITERLEAGMVLVGSEVKSLREARGSLAEGYVQIRRGEAWLVNAQINEYPWANQFNHDPMRERKLLLHRDQIEKLDTKVSQKGFSVVPIQIYLKGGRIKLELGVGRGKREYEKRDSKRAAEAKREIDRAMKR